VALQLVCLWVGELGPTLTPSPRSLVPVEHVLLFSQADADPKTLPGPHIWPSQDPALLLMCLSAPKTSLHHVHCTVLPAVW
jgi:hypothetical protein